MSAHPLLDLQPIQFEGVHMVPNEHRSVGVPVLQRDRTPIEPNERGAGPNAWRAYLKLERHRGIDPMLIGDATQGEVDDGDPINVERRQEPCLSINSIGYLPADWAAQALPLFDKWMERPWHESKLLQQPRESQPLARVFRSSSLAVPAWFKPFQRVYSPFLTQVAWAGADLSC
ncbi:hypothetical protein [Sphingomonas melonis]|uniref:Uncharacterized protein n=1 Tax=Sphingomonas melonis TaxID=152682 RepID=A0A7Y9FMD1_9SPHN|nr:hypothetical protein [Sphingomonas melonis]NYD89965.1 hypothetical protein [Sphingomonas melonis]